MDKCLWGNLKTRLSFESKLTIQKILETADAMEKSMPHGDDMRFQKPGKEDFYKTFNKKFSLEPEVSSYTSTQSRILPCSLAHLDLALCFSGL